MAIWTEILPNDSFRVKVKRSLSPAEFYYLTHLYQPLAGSVSIGLFHTLYNELPADRFTSSVAPHRWLMSLLSLPLDEIVEARKRLEALGLVRTIKWEGQGAEKLFEYILHPPFTPCRFFQDDVLRIMLYNKVGQKRYRFLQQKFGVVADDAAIAELTAGMEKMEITRSFDEVYHFLSLSELDVQPDSESEQLIKDSGRDITFPVLDETAEAGDLTLAHVTLDFDYLIAVIPKWADARILKDKETQRQLEKWAYLYSIDSESMGRLLQEPVIYDEEDQLDPGQLKKMIQQWYQKRSGGKPPLQVPVRQQSAEPVGKQGVETTPVGDGDPSDLYKSHMKRLETTPPLALLEEYQGGGKVSAADQKIIEELLDEYLLPPGVVNVLLEYVMYTQNRQLPRSLIFKIAAHWRRAGIQNVEQAQKQAKLLYKKYLSTDQKPAVSTRGKRSYTQRERQKKQDSLPAWVIEQLEQEKSEENEKDRTAPDGNDGENLQDPAAYQEQKRRIAQLLKELKSKS